MALLLKVFVPKLDDLSWTLSMVEGEGRLSVICPLTSSFWCSTRAHTHSHTRAQTHK